MLRYKFPVVLPSGSRVCVTLCVQYVRRVYGKWFPGYARERHCRTAGCLWTSEPGSAAGANEPDRAAVSGGSARRIPTEGRPRRSRNAAQYLAGALFRSFMEGETYEMKLNIDCLEDIGISLKRIITGAFPNPTVDADPRRYFSSRRSACRKIAKAGTLASAILCYNQIGLYDSILQAQEDLIRYKRHLSSAAGEPTGIPRQLF